ncbi:MAG TPA: CBS domain-containing protein [Capsulimonadaceae bacterium]
MTIGDTTLQSAIFVTPETTVAEAFETIDRAGCDGLLIEGDAGKIGVVEYGELHRMVTRPDADKSVRVAEFALICPFETSLDTPVRDTLARMRRYGLEIVPVYQSGHVTGVATLTAITKALRDELRGHMRESGHMTGAQRVKVARRRSAK